MLKNGRLAQETYHHFSGLALSAGQGDERAHSVPYQISQIVTQLTCQLGFNLYAEQIAHLKAASHVHILCETQRHDVADFIHRHQAVWLALPASATEVTGGKAEDG